jgi:hypothetical protein
MLAARGWQSSDTVIKCGQVEEGKEKRGKEKRERERERERERRVSPKCSTP